AGSELSRRRDNSGGTSRSEFSRQRESCRRRQEPCAGARIRPFDAYAWKRAYTPRQEVEHRKRVQFCLSRPWCFSAKERAFLSDIEKLRGNLTIRQGDWLAALTDRLERELHTA
ncbi:hypothetical protein, partial [Methylobacterium sp. SI9]|uniref:hypothetical protein n=1 Tax=Methylobacterium guangdongense TaxID=3138811 RepID=UPI00313C91B6